MTPRDQKRLRADHALFVLWVVLSLMASPLAADDFSVTNTANSGAGSLRQGVLDSNAVAGPNSITFSTDVPGDSTIQLLSPLANIATELEIDGTDPGGLTVAGDGTNFTTVDVAQRFQLTDIRFDSGALLLDTDATVAFDITDMASIITIDEVIGDASMNAGGKLEKLGDGTLILSGMNTFTGTALVSAGTLEVSTDSLISNADIISGATLRFLQTPDGTYSGTIVGGGALVKDGPSALSLTGANTYTGGTTISSGTLIGAPGSIQGNVLTQSGAVLELVDNVGSTFEGTLSGSGTIIKSGTGILVLAPTGTANSWANAQVTQGGLRGDAAAISGNVDLATMTMLEVDESGTGTLSGDLSGDGVFQKLGMGTVTLTGNNTGLTSMLPGAITVANGTLVGQTNSIPTNVLVQPSTTLRFDQSSDGSYNQVISGGGDFEKLGAGRLTFTSGQTYSGTTAINAGRLDVLAALTSDTTISNAGTLGGTGTIMGSVANSGRVAPGTSIGTLTVDSIVFAAGSTLEIETEPALPSDRLAVTGTADLTGGTLEVDVGSGTYTNQVTTILTAGTSISGSLAFTDNLPLVDITMQTLANSVTLTIHTNGVTIGSIAATNNQRAIGDALDTEAPTAGPDLTEVIDSLDSLTAPEIQAALDSMSGETLTQFATVRLEHADRFDQVLHSRLRESSDSLDLLNRKPKPERRSGGLPPVSAGPAASGKHEIEYWIQPYATFGDIEGHSGESNVDYTLAGAALGVETSPFFDSTNLLRHFRVGAAFAYGNSTIDFDDRQSSGDADSYMGALYGGWSSGRFRAGLSGRVGYSEMDSDRRITSGALIRNANADFEGLDFGSKLEAGGKLIQDERYVLETFGSIDYTRLQRKAFTESGAASINLRVDREKLESLRLGAGMRIRGIFEMDGDLELLPELRGEWRHQLLDREREIDANFRGATANPGFTIRGADLQRNSANVGVGWTVRSDTRFEAGVAYDLGIDTDRFAHSLAIRLGTRW